MDTNEVCAPAHKVFGGEEIKLHQDRVKKLQMRIVKAVQQQKHNKVKALQWLLTHSYSAKVLAVHKVTTNRGKKTPGVDGTVWKTEEEKQEAVNNLRRTGYQAQPLRRIYIPKKNGKKKRPLGIPTMKDRACQALYLMGLEPLAESVLDHGTYGFRARRSTADAIEAVFKATAANPDCAEWILEGDIKACFDGISHEWLMGNIPTDKRMLNQWLKAGVIFEGKYSKTEEGTPQGGVISPCIMSLALNGLESQLEKKIKTRRYENGREVNTKLHTVVYADDFIVTGKSRELLEKEVLPEIKQFLEERGLELSEEKTRIIPIEEGFDFLGQNIRKYKGKVLIKPSKKNVKSFLDEIRKVIRKHQTIKQEDLIAILNPKLQGWANYHRHVVSKKTYSYVDFQIYKAIWKWCRRRHNDKGKWWISERYFHSRGGRNWVFGVESQEKGWTQLYRTSDTKIIRHKKIQKEANPYAEEWQSYFEEREGERMFEGMSGRQALKRMWKNQNGRCTLCGGVVETETGWKTHRNQENKNEIVHPLCHRKLHPELRKTSPVLIM